MTDIVSKNSAFDLAFVKSEFDLVYTYDHNDAKKYGFEYHTTVYSPINTNIKNKDIREDLFFCGMAKERMNLISRISEYLSENDVKHTFYVPDACDTKDENISPERLDYSENIARVLESNCILEIEQNGASGYTLRTWEALQYKKKLLTNNKKIIEADFYDPKYIKVFSNPEDIDLDWLKIHEKVEYSNYNVSVISFFQDISDYFNCEE